MPVEITARKKPFRQRLRRDMRENWVVYLLLLPVIIWYIIFCYLPMFGIVMAFENFKFAKGLFGSAWVGFRNFEKFFSSYYFWRLLRNTLTLIFDSMCCIMKVILLFVMPVDSCPARSISQSISETLLKLPGLSYGPFAGTLLHPVRVIPSMPILCVTESILTDTFCTELL